MDKMAEAIAHHFVRAINSQDIAGLADLMTSEHRFIDSLGNVVVGQHEVRRGWVGYFAMVPDYAITVLETYGFGSVVVMIGTAKGTFVPPIVPSEELSYYLTPPKAKPEPAPQLNPEYAWKTPAAFRVVVEKGRVAEWRVYADNEPIREQMRKSKNKETKETTT